MMLLNKLFKSIMFVGTASGMGKSLVATAFCCIFLQDGFVPATFKVQNMSSNSYATSEVLEIGRTQAVQAEVAGIKCDPDLNPVLLKPTSDTGFQVILNGRVHTMTDNDSINDLIFYDRGIPDLVSYLKLANVPVHPSITVALIRYTNNHIAFILPPWREIFKFDDERWQTFEESELIFSYLVKVYTKLDFKLITLPKITANQRAGLILNILKQKSL